MKADSVANTCKVTVSAVFLCGLGKNSGFIYESGFFYLKNLKMCYILLRYGVDAEKSSESVCCQRYAVNSFSASAAGMQ